MSGRDASVEGRARAACAPDGAVSDGAVSDGAVPDGAVPDGAVPRAGVGRRRVRLWGARPLRRAPCRVVCPRGAEDGSAVVEFLGAALVLLVPLVYLVLVVGRLQAASFAAEAAASEAARVFVAAPDEATGSRLALAAVRMSFEDEHVALADPAGAVRLDCEGACGVPDGVVTARVRVDVPLPGVPAFVRGHVPLSVAVRADATDAFGRFADLSGWP